MINYKCAFDATAPSVDTTETLTHPNIYLTTKTLLIISIHALLVAKLLNGRNFSRNRAAMDENKKPTIMWDKEKRAALNSKTLPIFFTR